MKQSFTKWIQFSFVGGLMDATKKQQEERGRKTLQISPPREIEEWRVKVFNFIKRHRIMRAGEWRSLKAKNLIISLRELEEKLNSFALILPHPLAASARKKLFWCVNLWWLSLWGERKGKKHFKGKLYYTTGVWIMKKATISPSEVHPVKAWPRDCVSGSKHD